MNTHPSHHLALARREAPREHGFRQPKVVAAAIVAQALKEKALQPLSIEQVKPEMEVAA